MGAKGKLIVVVGNCGIGKTTLTLKLCEVGNFAPFLEENVERPYQERFQDNLHGFSFLNQVDFFLFRAEQEIFIRENDVVGVQDGGLDQDYHVFTRCFHQKSYLNDDEYLLCKRLYLTLRKFLPMPDLIIRLTAPIPVLAERMTKRQREIDIIKPKDLDDMENFIEEWLAKVISIPVIKVNAEEDDPSYSNVIDGLVRDLNNSLNIKNQ